MNSNLPLALEILESQLYEHLLKQSDEMIALYLEEKDVETSILEVKIRAAMRALETKRQNRDNFRYPQENKK